MIRAFAFLFALFFPLAALAQNCGSTDLIAELDAEQRARRARSDVRMVVGHPAIECDGPGSLKVTRARRARRRAAPLRRALTAARALAASGAWAPSKLAALPNELPIRAS